MAQAEAWARDRSQAGIRLETQDTNVAACRLYERCGFVLGGFDRHLYAALPGSAGETALFWYRLFERRRHDRA
jgi:streptothricin acetyltransferase